MEPAEGWNADWHMMFSNSPVAMMLVSSERILLAVNGKFCAMYGYEPDELIGRSIEILHVDRAHYEGLTPRFEAVRQGLELAVFDYPSRTKDGRILWIELGGARFALGDGTTGVLWSAVDVTVRKEAVEALAEHEEIYRVIVSQAGDAIELIDPVTLAYVEINDAACAMLGYHHDELLQMSLPDIQGGEMTRASILEGMRGLRDSGETAVFENRHRRKNGEIFDVWISARYIEIRGRELVVAVWRDMTAMNKVQRELQESRQLLRTVIDENPNVILLKDSNGKFVLANKTLADLYATTPEAMIGKDDGAFNPNRRQVEFYHRNVQEILRSGVTQTVMEESTDVRTGQIRFFQSIKKPLVAPNGETQLLVIANDVTDLREARHEAIRSRQQLEYALAAIGEGVWDWDIPSQTVRHNRQWSILLGRASEETVDPISVFNDLIFPEDRELVAGRLRCAMTEGTPYRSEHRMQHADGRIIWIADRGQVVEWDGRGHAIRMVGSFADITEQRAADEKVERLAHFDPLTGLPNRMLFTDRVTRALHSAQRHGGHVAMLFLDLDNFKHINDTLGHTVGDKLLVHLAQRLTASVREEDTVSRLGGDEFLILLPSCDREGGRRVAQKLLENMARPCRIERHEFVVTPSIGIAVYPDDGGDYETLLRCADTAMYRAKHDGRNTFCHYVPQMQERAIRVLTLETNLRRAVERGEFELHYQPQVSLESGDVIGVEALIRWNHPQMGIISPVEFIPLAEENGMIVPIGEWVIRTAVAQIQQYREESGRPLSLAVNLSAVQFRQENLPRMIGDILDEYGFPAELLEVELTESAAMRDPQTASVMMNRLKAMGIGVSIDDFGTGYSSLSYLKRFPISKLKIDRSFVRDVGQDDDDEAIVRAVISLARTLKFTTIAEGAETQEQMSFLRGSGCDHVQGYFIAPPLPYIRLKEFLSGQAALTSS